MMNILARSIKQLIQKLNNEKYLVFWLFFVSFISYFFIKYTGLDSTFPIYWKFSEEIKIFFYSLIPHLTVDISYIILIYIFPFLLFVWYSILKRQINMIFIFLLF